MFQLPMATQIAQFWGSDSARRSSWPTSRSRCSASSRSGSSKRSRSASAPGGSDSARARSRPSSSPVGPGVAAGRPGPAAAAAGRAPARSRLRHDPGAARPRSSPADARVDPSLACLAGSSACADRITSTRRDPRRSRPRSAAGSVDTRGRSSPGGVVEHAVTLERPCGNGPALPRSSAGSSCGKARRAIASLRSSPSQRNVPSASLRWYWRWRTANAEPTAASSTAATRPTVVEEVSRGWRRAHLPSRSRTEGSGA